ncbi:MAG: gliding motility lipoprotein GldH [Williamsia sp.]|nr:gliding motility lipoprotein GldH [Williamsia sp.]
MKNTVILTLVFLLSACTKIDVFEKSTSFKDHRWQSTEKPSVSFTISDTLSQYNLFVVIRHSDAYNFSNIWMNVFTQAPGDSTKKQLLNLQLADNKQGWLGSGMDDIFEQRIPITASPVRFGKPGEYKFSFEQIMREDPLEHVLNVGLRIERVKQD